MFALMKESVKIDDFSPYLFWDIDKSQLDLNTSKEQIIYKVVEYGMMKDWLLLQKIYPKEVIKEVVLNLRSLDKVTISYLSHFFKIDKTQFRCYKQSQSSQYFWNS